jgi:hypothetical protein
MENNFYKGVPPTTCYSIESYQRLKVGSLQSGNVNGRWEEDEVLNP